MSRKRRMSSWRSSSRSSAIFIAAGYRPGSIRTRFLFPILDACRPLLRPSPRRPLSVLEWLKDRWAPADTGVPPRKKEGYSATDTATTPGGLPAIVREGLVGLGHLVHVFALLHGAAAAV